MVAGVEIGDQGTRPCPRPGIEGPDAGFRKQLVQTFEYGDGVEGGEARSGFTPPKAPAPTPVGESVSMFAAQSSESNLSIRSANAMPSSVMVNQGRADQDE